MNKERKIEIELHFSGILKEANTFEQVSGFYRGVVRGLILEVLYINGTYNYNGFPFHFTDIGVILLILEEHCLKERILYELR